MKRVIAVLNAILANPVVGVMPDLNNNIVKGHLTDLIGQNTAELKVERVYEANDNNEATESVHVYIRGYKVYGFSGDFITAAELAEVNTLFTQIQIKQYKKRSELEREAKNFFDANFPEIKG